MTDFDESYNVDRYGFFLGLIRFSEKLAHKNQNGIHFEFLHSSGRGFSQISGSMFLHRELYNGQHQCKVKFLFIAISGICHGIFESFRGSQRAASEPMCLPTMTQAGRELH